MKHRVAVVKRVFVELRDRVSYLKRLAFFTFTEEETAEFDFFDLTGSKEQDIDAKHQPADEKR